MKHATHFSITLFLIFCFLFCTPGVGNIYADELTPTPEPITEVVESTDAAVDENPNQEFEVENPTESSDDENLLMNTEETPGVTPDTEMAETLPEPAESDQHEEPMTLPEILDEVPEETQIILLDENGEELALATVEATDTLASGDPVWCPNTVATPTPGSNGCTSSYLSMADLLAVLSGGSYSGSGIIWVADSYDGNDDQEIVIDGSALTTLQSYDLGIYGGWDDGNGDSGTVGISDFDVSITIKNWLGSVTLKNLFVNNTTDTNHYGLDINANGVTLENVEVNNTSGSKNGAQISSTSHVVVTNSTFNQNNGDGLTVSSDGMVSLVGVETSGNTLRGAVINTCQEDPTTELCTGIGSVIIYDGLFSNNGTSGLIIDSNNAITIDGIQAENNAMWGAKLEANELGLVIIANSSGSPNIFSGNQTGLSVNTNQIITLISSAFTSNNLGAYLLADAGMQISNSAFNENTYTGLHAESGDIIDFGLIEAKNNGINGAYLIADGDIKILASTEFSGNAKYASSGGNGLYAESLDGAISTSMLMLVEDNKFGIGTHFITHNDNPITTGMLMNSGNQIGLVAESENGDINLVMSGFKSNTQGGVKAISSGSGNISLNTVQAHGNGNINIFASTNSGNINALALNVSGADDSITPIEAETLTGLYLLTHSSGSEIRISNAMLYDHIGDGAFMVSDGSVMMINSHLIENGGNGIHVLSSSSTKKCRSGSESDTSVQVMDIFGSYTSNAEYGILVDSGPGGSLTVDALSSVSNFENNLFGDTLLNIASLPLCSDPVEPDANKDNEHISPTPASKPFKHIVVAPQDETEASQECQAYGGTFFEMPDGGSIQLPCPFSGSSRVKSFGTEDIPGSLNGIGQFISGFMLTLMDQNEILTMNPDGRFTYSIKIPQQKDAKQYTLMFWDPTMNEGSGGWFILPPYEAGVSFFVGENDDRMILSGVREVDGFLVFTANFSGTFLLVEN